MSDVDAAVTARLASWTGRRRRRAPVGEGRLAVGRVGQAADEIAAWLGWLDLPATMSARVAELEHLARDVREDGYRRAAVLGMGGSSLAPELFSRVFGWAGGRLAIARHRPTGWSCASSTRRTPTWCAASGHGPASSAPSSA